jgi:hypothetical protein
MNLNELKQKPLWQMTGEEFLYLQKTSMDTGRTMAESAHMVTMLIQED